MLLRLFLLVSAVSSTVAFLPSAPQTTSAVSRLQAEKKSSFFTGGAFDEQEEEAAKIASRIKSVKDLGWTGPPKRRGSARPRHRAFGGSSEKPVQLKPNYDESNPLCVEKWLSQEDFYEKVRDSSPAADSVFVALAGGAAFAEREVAEEKIAQWVQGNKFDKDAFLKTVKEGRSQLAAGWGLFGFVVGFAVLGIVFPTNPGVQAFESVLAQLQGGYVLPQ